MKKIQALCLLLAIFLFGNISAQIQHFTWQGVQRDYLVRIPANHEGTLPVLFFLHGLGDNILTDLGKGIVNKTIEVALNSKLEVDNYFLFNTTHVELGDETKTLSLGIFGHVFTFDKEMLRDALEEAAQEKVQLKEERKAAKLAEKEARKLEKQLKKEQRKREKEARKAAKRAEKEAKKREKEARKRAKELEKQNKK